MGNFVLTILRGPIDAGLLFPNAYMAAALLVLKLFDVWSTNYIVGRKGGRETNPIVLVGIKYLGTLQRGMALDFAVCAIATWFTYPYWWQIGGVLAWYAYWVALQAQEWKKSRPE